MNAKSYGLIKITLTLLGSYDFHDTENTDGIVESRHENRICNNMWNGIRVSFMGTRIYELHLQSCSERLLNEN